MWHDSLMSDIEQFTSLILKFIEQRNWKKFHNPKDLAISLSLEASEVLEHFQWKNEAEITQYLSKQKKEIGKELADVLYWVLLMSHGLDIDIKKAFIQKMKENVRKYPIKKSKGKYSKYTEL